MLFPRALLYASFVVMAASCFGQMPKAVSPETSDGEVRALLGSSQPKDVAWGAYAAGRQNRRDLIPTLAGLLDRYEVETAASSGSVSPQAAAIQAVADALILLKANLPNQTVMHLYPKFPAQTVVLLAKSSDSESALLEIFKTTQNRDLWLAAGNLLAPHAMPEFIRTLLGGMVTTFVFRIVSVGAAPDRTGFGEGCALDSGMILDRTFRDWPRIWEYALVTSKSPENVFAPGIHPVGFYTWETTDYRNGSSDDDCGQLKSLLWRTGLLGQIMGKDLKSIALKPEVLARITCRSHAEVENQMRVSIAEQSQAFAAIVETLVQSSALTVADSAELKLKCRVWIEDERPWPRTELPLPDTGSCTIAPLKAKGDNTPE